MANRILKIVLAFIIIVLIFTCFDAYFFYNKTFVAKLVERVVPIPVVYGKGVYITFSEYNDLYNFYKKNIYPNDPEIRKNSLDYVVNIKLMQKAITDFDIKLNGAKYKEFEQNFYDKNDIKKLSVDSLNFAKYVLEPAFIESAINFELSKDFFNQSKKEKMVSIYGELLKDPSLFDKYASEYFDKNMLFGDGEISWLPNKDLPENIQESIGDMKINDFTEVKKSISGFHIYKLVSRLEGKTGEEPYYKLQQIFIPLMNFDEYSQNLISKSEMKYLLPNYATASVGE